MNILKRCFSLLFSVVMIISVFSAVTVFAEDPNVIEPYYVQDFDKDTYSVSNGGNTYAGYDTWIADDQAKFSTTRASQASWISSIWEIKTAVYSEADTGNKYLRIGRSTTVGMKNGPFDEYLENAALLGADSYRLKYDIKFENPDAERHGSLTWRTSSADHMSVYFEKDSENADAPHTVWYKIHHNSSSRPTGMINSGITYTADTWHYYENGMVSVLFDDQILYTGDARYSTFTDSVWNDNVYQIKADSATAMGLDNFEISAHKTLSYSVNFDKVSMCDDTLSVDGSVSPAGRVKLKLNLKDSGDNVLYTKNIFTSLDGKFSDTITVAMPIESDNHKLDTEIFPIFTGTDTQRQIMVYNLEDRLLKLDFTEKTAEQVNTSITSDLTFYDIDVSESSPFYALVDKNAIFSALSGNSYNTVSEFKNAFSYETTFQGMRETVEPSIMVGIIEDNGELFNLNLSGAFQDYKTEICGLIISNIENIGDAEELSAYIRKAEVYYELVNSTRVKIEDTVNEYLDSLNEYGLTEDFEDANGKKQKNMCLSILEIEFEDEDVFDLDERIDTIIKKMNKEYEKQEETKKKTSGGGGGGGSYVRPVTIVDTPKTEVPPVVDTQVVPPKEEVPVNTEKKFADVNNEHWASEAIKSVNDKGIMVGNDNGDFLPDQNIKREEFAKIIVEAFEIDVEASDVTFDDVDISAWYYDYIKTAFASELIQGQSEALFGTGSDITRQDVSVILYRLLKDKMSDEELGDEVSFEDEADISDYAKDAVKFMAKHKFMVGEDGSFNPNKPMTRAMAAQLIFNILSTK